MAREAFIAKRFKSSSVKIIAQANEIINEYSAKGFTLTLRQLYYQFVARDLIKNQQSEYKRLGAVINDARLAGLIDWDAIEDRTRYLRSIANYTGPAAFIETMAGRYAEHLWRDQSHYVEVWIEKDALVGVIERVCNEFRVPYFPCRGYNSQSEQYTAGKRLKRQLAKGKKVTVFHLGDHDPSGINMTTDNQDRLMMFARSISVDVIRLGLNMDQVEQYDPPPNPAKDSDTRFAQYAEQFGDECWELDALSPEVIEQLVRDAIEGVLDQDKWDAAREAEQHNEELLTKLSTYWSSVEEHLASL